jgi:hypothetical protein
MDPVQWLIDCLRIVQGQDPVAQIGLVFAGIAPILFVIAWVRRSFRRGYQEIEDENAELTSQINAVKEALKNVRQENARLGRERQSLQARLPESVLSLVEQEIDDGNYRPAIRKLRGMFDDLSPGLADCLLQLNELALAPTGEEIGAIAAVDTERYRQLSVLLRDKREKAPPS